MKKREITNNDLEQMFTNIIEQEPLLTVGQVNSLMNNLPKTNWGNAVKNFFKYHLNIFLIIATIVLIFTAALIWLNSDNQSEEATLQNNPEKNVVAPVTADTITAEPTIIINKEISRNKANEDTFILDFDTIQTETAISLYDVYRHFEKKPQVFSIQANRDTAIICKEGTMIQINANSFISEKTGNTISRKVQLKVKEYYKISDMILANLTTTSGEKIIETGGMLNISATSNSENCILKPGFEIKTGFPYSGKKDDMALFYGEQTNNIIDWKLADKTDDVKIEDELIITVSSQRESNSEVFFIVEDMPEFPGGDLALRNYLEQNVSYPYSLINKKIEGKVRVTFIVDAEGNTRNIKVVQGLDDTLDKVAVYVVSNFPQWKPGRQRGKPVNVLYTIPVVFSGKEGDLTAGEIRQSKELEEKIKDFKYDIDANSYYANNNEFEEFEKNVKDENFQKTNASEVNRYIFSVTQLGWINCDKFYKSNNRMIDLFIPIDDSKEIIVNAVFQRFKALIPGNVQSGKITFSNIPEGDKVTIVAIKSVDNKIFLAVKEILATNNGEIKLDFQEVNFELLKNEMEKLNKYY